MVLARGTKALPKAVIGVSALTREQWQPLHIPKWAAVSGTHGQWCTVQEMMREVGGPSHPTTGSGLHVLKLVRLARHHTHGSPQAEGEAMGYCGAGAARGQIWGRGVRARQSLW